MALGAQRDRLLQLMLFRWFASAPALTDILLDEKAVISTPAYVKERLE